MLTINKLSLDHVIDFAAEELKKYLRMMMPYGGDIAISYSPEAKTGFRLALMADLSLDTSDVESRELDDIVYIDTDREGGIIAGSNPRATLIAVYEYLRKNGCRWLFPGVDGEYIPMKDIEPVKYRHAASCRYRGQCIEGGCSQEILLETIAFLPKVGMNVFQMQFMIPTVFYDRYYSRKHNGARRKAAVSERTMLGWKMACEVEMAKRGIQFHDVGHGWTAAPFGIDITGGWNLLDEDDVPEEARPYLAMVNGKRRFFRNALSTQFCMSSHEARGRVASYISDYAEKHTNVDYIHVWLADGHNNHCECPECRKKTPSDWYMVLLNEIDEELTKRRLNTRIVFIAYTDTTWAPVTESIKNPDRFTLMIAPISRDYTRTVTNVEPTIPPYVHNKIEMPRDLDEYLAHLKAWKKVWRGASLCFEYHFWKHQNYEPVGLILARRIFEDIAVYKQHGLNGMIACGSQRAYFPTGFAYYVFARGQFDTSLTFEELKEDYFKTAFGDEWQNFVTYLEMASECFGQAYLEGKESANYSISKYYNPERAEKLRNISEATKYGKELISRQSDFEDRIKTVSVGILDEFISYSELLAKTFAYKADGDDDGARSAFKELRDYMDAREVYIERYFEHFISMHYHGEIVNQLQYIDF